MSKRVDEESGECFMIALIAIETIAFKNVDSLRVRARVARPRAAALLEWLHIHYPMLSAIDP